MKAIAVTGDGVDEMNGVGEPNEVSEGPIEGVLAVRAVKRKKDLFCYWLVFKKWAPQVLVILEKCC